MGRLTALIIGMLLAAVLAVMVRDMLSVDTRNVPPAPAQITVQNLNEWCLPKHRPCTLRHYIDKQRGIVCYVLDTRNGVSISCLYDPLTEPQAVHNGVSYK